MELYHPSQTRFRPLTGQLFFYEPLDQIVETYGRPDRVTWGPDFNLRSLIWSEMGVLIFVPLSGRRGGPILLFPPIPSDALEASWLMASLPEGLVGSPEEDEDFGPKLEMED